MASSSPNISLKLLIDKKGQRVLFAETPKQFVDLIFHIFSLPVSTLFHHIGSDHMVGCLGKLKKSVETFDPTYLQPGINRDEILNPKTALNANMHPLLLHDSTIANSSTSESRRDSFSSDGFGSPSPGFRSSPSFSSTPRFGVVSSSPGSSVGAFSSSSGSSLEGKGKVGYVKEVVTYMVEDDLTVNPMSAISTITLINRFGVNDLGQLQEKTVIFGKPQVSKLLKACLMTDKVLTAVFLHDHGAY